MELRRELRFEIRRGIEGGRVDVLGARYQRPILHRLPNRIEFLDRGGGKPPATILLAGQDNTAHRLTRCPLRVRAVEERLFGGVVGDAAEVDVLRPVEDGKQERRQTRAFLIANDGVDLAQVQCGRRFSGAILVHRRQERAHRVARRLQSVRGDHILGHFAARAFSGARPEHGGVNGIQVRESLAAELPAAPVADQRNVAD